MKTFTLASALAAALIASPLVNATVFLGLRRGRFGDESQVAWYVSPSTPF